MCGTSCSCATVVLSVNSLHFIMSLELFQTEFSSDDDESEVPDAAPPAKRGRPTGAGACIQKD